MAYDLILKNANVDDQKPLVDIAIEKGKIVDIRQGISGDTVEDLAGDVVVPSFIEAHIHLDKALLERVRPNKEGTLAGAIKTTGELKKGFQDEEVFGRAKRVLDMLLSHGTTIVRAQPDTDPLARLVGFDAMMKLKEQYLEFVDMSVFAFAQEGIAKEPTAYDFLDRALKKGADGVAGCPYNEKDFDGTKQHVDAIFELGKKYNKDVGFHADFGDNVDDKRYRSIDYIIERTIENGYQGRVSVGHMTSLSSVEPSVLVDTIGRMAGARINLVTLPATDLFLSGRGDNRAMRRGLLNPTPFIKGGVNHCFATNNIQNGFTPFGTGDLLMLGNLYEHACQLGTPADQRMLLDMITKNPAKALHIESTYGLEVGKNADLVVLGTKRLADIFIEVPIRRYVIKRGRVIFRSEQAKVRSWAV
jgi:cytosine/creatinine deaminase